MAVGESSRYAVIGGTSLLKSKFFEGFKDKLVDTEYGKVALKEDEASGAVFVQRHHADGDKGAEVYNPPHLIKQKAYMSAIKQLGITRVLGVCCVGSLTKEFTVGTIVVPDDFFNFVPITIYDDARGHLVPGVSEQMRTMILESIKDGGFESIIDHGTYVQTVGPRFETKAEVRFYSTVGDVIGMTSADEAVMANELGLEYAMICMIDNYANGLVGATLTEEEFKANVANNQKTVERAVGLVLDKLSVA